MSTAIHTIDITEPEFKTPVILPDPSDLSDNRIPPDHRMESCLCDRSSDKRCGIFVMQVVISLSVLTLCLIKLEDENLDCSATNIYVALLTIIFGIWLPSPMS